MSDDVQDFLDREAAQGSFDSTGSFTVDWAKAREKFARHHTADPKMLVLILVQVAVRCGASEIHFRESQGRMLEGPPGLEMFARCGSDTALTLTRLRTGLLQDPLTIHEETLRDIVAALAGALSRGEVGVFFRGPNSWSLLQHSRLRSRTTGNGYVFLFDDFLVDIDLHELLRSRCCFCPIPIYWNHEILARSWPPGPRFLERIHSGNGLGLGVRSSPKVGPGKRRASPLPPRPLYCRQRIEKGGVTVIGGSRSDLQHCSAVLSMPLALRGPDLLVPVRFGVTLEPVGLKSYFGCQVVVNADSAPVDLSGFQARQGEELERLRQWANQEIQKGARFLLSEVPDPAPLKQGSTRRWGIRATYALLGLATLIKLPPLGALLLFKACYVGADPHKEERQTLAESRRLRDRLYAVIGQTPPRAPRSASPTTEQPCPISVSRQSVPPAKSLTAREDRSQRLSTERRYRRQGRGGPR